MIHVGRIGTTWVGKVTFASLLKQVADNPVTANTHLKVAVGGNGGVLSSREWLKVLDSLSRGYAKARTTRITSVDLDLSDATWIGHLPLLALCLLVARLESLHVENAVVTMPRSDSVRAFLERWGFYAFSRTRSLTTAGNPTLLYQQSFRQSCVLPIRAVREDKDAREVADDIQRVGTDVYELLRTASFLDDEGIRGLADLIVHELLMNAIEHAVQRDAFVFGRISKPDDKVRALYEENAAPWEKKFFDAIHGEGMTELTLGDAGLGIVQTLTEEARRYGHTTSEDILKWSFEPFSTSKGEGGDHTRGLWVVKNKVRDLRGVLYVRTWDGASGGVGAWWDFFNDPGREEPEITRDIAAFPGTQFQILLPHLTAQRPYTFISCDRAAAKAASRELRPVGFQIPAMPSASGERVALRDTIAQLDQREVLFIDMSRMDADAWNRRQVDVLGHDISLTGLSAGVHSGLGTHFRRIWLLNPKEEMLMRLASSSWVEELWRRHGVLQPVVMSDDDATKPPRVRFVVRHAEVASNNDGDTAAARSELYRLISNAFGHDLVNRSLLSPELTPAERSWVTVHLAMNSPSVELRPDGVIAPAFDVETLANATVEALLPHTLREQIDQEFAAQNAMTERLLYQLPSEKYCTNYIAPRILTDLDAPARTAMEKWIEERVAESRAAYAMSYTNFASMLLTRASRGNLGIRCLPPIKHYIGEAYAELQRKIPPYVNVVLLVAVSGSGSTIEKILEHLQPLDVTASVICLINTQTSEQRKKMPLLASIEEQGRFHCLLTKPIEIYDAIPDGYAKGDVAPIDPETLVPLPPPRSFDNVLMDGDFWMMTAEARGLSIGPITYKGRDHTTLFWMRNIFKSSGPANAPALEAVLHHLATCFKGRAPDIICANRETNHALKGTEAKLRTETRFPSAKVISEADADFDQVASKLEGKHVVIFSAAAYSGSAITRLLKKFATARRIHICVFLTRISEPMIASFTRQPKVTFAAFRQLYSGSSESSMGSSRTVRLQDLADYRPSCLSHRLLLFVEELQQEAERHVGAPDPDTLELVTRPLPPATPGLFRTGETYKLTSEQGVKDLEGVVSRCDEADAQWVYAVLEEAASHFEIARRGLDLGRNTYVGAVSRLFNVAANASVKLALLDALLLDRWHGREEIGGHDIPGFGVALLGDLIRSDSPPEFRAACIRALSKVDRQRLIAELECVIEVSCTHRETELTLALELTKILDDERGAEQLCAGFESILNKRVATPKNATGVAIECLLNDVGLHYANRKVSFLPWEDMVQILASEPRDMPRTIRSLIRAIRGYLGARARVLYYRRDDDELTPDRFVYHDDWPRRKSWQPRTVPVRNVIAATLLDDTHHDFYSPNVSVSDPKGEDRAYERYYLKLDEQAREDLKDNAMFLDTVGRTGILRVFYNAPDGAGMPAGAVQKLQKAVTDVNKLLSRSDSPLTRIGTFQYRQTVEKFHLHTADGLDPLHEFVKHVHSLLGADVGSLVVLDDDGANWRRDFILPPDEMQPLMFRADDPQRVTVDVARSRRFRRFSDQEARTTAGFKYDGLVSWAPAWLAMPMAQYDKCRVVLHLWHHIPAWFDRHPEDLINSLSSLGGGIAQIKADSEKARDAQRQAFDKIEIDHIAARLRDMTLVAEFLARETLDKDSNAELAELFDCVLEIHRDVESLVTIVHQSDPVPSIADLSDLVTAAVLTVRGEYGEDKYNLPAMSGSHIAAPVSDPRMFLRALTRLLKSAKSNLKPGAKVSIGVDYGGTGAGVSIEIKKPRNGVEEQQRMFDSDGIELKLARIMARRHGGRIEEGGTPDEHVLRMTIPIRRGGQG